jgi:protease-4
MKRRPAFGTRRAGLLLLSSLLATLAGCEGRPRASSVGTTSAHEGSRTGPWVAVLDLSDGLPEQSSGGLLGLGAKSATMFDLVREVGRLDQAPNLRGVLVRLGTARLGMARAMEAADLLASVKAKVPVWCHADDFGNATMYLAAHGCSQVWQVPAGTADVVGLAAQTVYFHKLLAQELGLSVDFLQVGRFKGAEEPFTRDGPSDEARATLEETLGDLRAAWLEGIAAGRPKVEPVALEDGPYGAATARERGLIDEVGYFDQARDALEGSVGAGRAEVRLGSGVQDSGGGLSQTLRDITGDSFGQAPIAVVRATGAISMEGEGAFESRGIAEKHLARVLARLEKDDDVSAVVLRIDSPGGSALASDLLWHRLMKLRDKKPLVVSVGDMAASGGYYMASAGNAVFGEAGSIVGSIGVVGGKIAANQALERIGVHAETFSARADAGAASRAAFESLLMPWDEATRARVLQTMTGVYELFLARVAEGRKIPVERVRASAEGRIFGAREAKSRGLVDEIGGLRDAIERARTLAGLPADARASLADEAHGLLPALLDDDAPPSSESGLAFLGAQAAASPQALRLATSADPLVVPFVASLAPMVGREAVLCALPFALTVR